MFPEVLQVSELIKTKFSIVIWSLPGIGIGSHSSTAVFLITFLFRTSNGALCSGAVGRVSRRVTFMDSQNTLVQIQLEATSLKWFSFALQKTDLFQDVCKISAMNQ